MKQHTKCWQRRRMLFDIVFIRRTTLAAGMIFGALTFGFRAGADDFVSLDRAVQSVVKLAESTEYAERPQAPTLSRAAVPSSSPQTARDPAASSVSQDILLQDFFGSESTEGAVDLKFSRENGKEDRGGMIIYLRGFRPGTQTVGQEKMVPGQWSRENGVVKIDAADRGQAVYQLDTDRGLLKRNSGSGIFMVADSLTKRALSANEMGPQGRQRFGK